MNENIWRSETGITEIEGDWRAISIIRINRPERLNAIELQQHFNAFAAPEKRQPNFRGR